MKTVASKAPIAPGTGSLSEQAVQYHCSRDKVCSLLSSLFPGLDENEYLPVEDNHLQSSRSELEGLANSLKASGHTDEQNVSLIEDLAGKSPKGQAGLAISTPEYYNTWGKHYSKY